MSSESDEKLTYTEHLDGTKAWRLDAEYHRDGAPAVLFPKGGEAWSQHGKLHRDGGPAFDGGPDGTKRWYQHGKMHRLDGPAEIFADGRQTWAIHDRKMTEVEFNAWHDAQRRQAGFNVAAGVQKTDHPVVAPATARFQRLKQQVAG